MIDEKEDITNVIDCDEFRELVAGIESLQGDKRCIQNRQGELIDLAMFCAEEFICCQNPTLGSSYASREKKEILDRIRGSLVARTYG